MFLESGNSINIWKLLIFYSQLLSNNFNCGMDPVSAVVFITVLPVLIVMKPSQLSVRMKNFENRELATTRLDRNRE